MSKKFSRRKLLIGAGTLACAGAGSYVLLRGFEDQPGEMVSELPETLRRAALDVHVHILGTGTGGSGCWMNEQMQRSLQVKAGLWTLRLRIDQPDLDQRYVEYLRSRMQRAGFLKQAVILAMDYTYSLRGERRADRTPFFTPNDYIAQLCRQHPEFLFGASIHPYRPDALEELARVAEQGAVLVKWIPNVQAIDLGEARCRAFYRAMAAHKMALLPHVGDEKALFVAGQEYGDPRRLVAPLEEGVTVIAAHAASLGERDARSNFEHFCDLLPKWPNLFADTSALTLATRWRMLRKVVERSGVVERLVHGSDFPIPPAASLYVASMRPGAWWNAWKRENPLLRDFLVKQELGMPAAAYTRGFEVLAPRLAPISHERAE